MFRECGLEDFQHEDTPYLEGFCESGWVHKAGTKTACGGSHVGRGTVTGWLMGRRDWVRDESPLINLGQPES